MKKTVKNIAAFVCMFASSLALAAPAGVATDLSVWYQGGAGTENSGNAVTSGKIDAWIDQSGNGADMVQSTVVDQPVILEKSTNYNPGVKFERPEETHLKSILGMHEQDYFMVLNSDNVVSSSSGGGIALSHRNGQGAMNRLSGSTSAVGGEIISAFYSKESAITLPPFGRSGVYDNTSGNIDSPVIVNIRTSAADSQLYIYRDGKRTDTIKKAVNYSVDPGRVPNIVLGARLLASHQDSFEGSIPELLSYSSEQSDADRNIITSYLSFKYGITLDQTTPTDYVASNGTTKMWDSSIDTDYNNRIFGVGRDDSGNIDQKVSRSTSAGAIVSVSLESNFNDSNTSTNRMVDHVSDMQFLAISSDGEDLSNISTNIDSAVYAERVGRTWLVQKENFNQVVSLKFDGYGRGYYLLISDDDDFSAGYSEVVELDSFGVAENLTLVNGDYFALGFIPSLGSLSDPASSCLDIKNNDASAPTGNYYLEFGSMVAPEQFFCEMDEAGGGWTLMFQRRGGSSVRNVESCGANLGEFLHNDCGDIANLEYGDSYSANVNDVIGEINSNSYLTIQYDSLMAADTDDAFIVHTEENLFSTDSGLAVETNYDKICDINNDNCDSNDGIWLYIPGGWTNSGICKQFYGYSNSYVSGTYGYCHDGFNSKGLNGLFGNRGGGGYPQSYGEQKAWRWANGLGKNYMERVFVRASNAAPLIEITAPTKLKNSDITNTTIVITDDVSVLAANVLVDASSTATASNLVCTQTSPIEVNCTIDITSSGTLVISATDDESATRNVSENNYVIDLEAPQVPSVNIDIASGVNNPSVSFSSLDNLAIDYYEIDYILDNGAAGLSAVTTIVPNVSPISLDLDADALTIPPSYHEIVVRAYDTAGNFSENISRFTPIVAYITPTLISNVDITNAIVTITSPGGNDLDSITLSNAGTTGSTGLVCANDLGGGVYESPATCTINNITATGTMLVTARDTVTNAVGQNSQSFIIDTTDPVLTITAPIKESNGEITTTTIKVTDDKVIDAADVSLAFINGSNSLTISNLNCTQTTTTEVDCTLEVDANSGTGDLEVTVTDRAGNEVIGTETGYEIDITAPVIVFTEDIEATLATSEAFTVTITDANPNTLAYVYGYSDDNTCDINDTYSELLTSGTEVEITDDSNTDKYVCVQARDKFNNISYGVSTEKLNIDTTKPAITFTDNVSAGPVQSDTVVLTSSDAHEDDTTYKYVLSEDGVCEDATYADLFTNGTPIVYNTEADNGKYVCAMATDTLGQTRYRRSTNVLNIDITLPVITIEEDSEVGPVQSDIIGFSVTDVNESPATYEYGFNTTDDCDVTSTYGNSFTSGTNITLNTEANNGDFVCAKAEDLTGNISYTKLTNPILVDVTAPVITFADDIELGSPSSDGIKIVVTDNIKEDTTTYAYAYSADSVCNGSDVYDKTYISNEGFVHRGEDENGMYICARAIDAAGNISYKASIRELNIQNNSASTVDMVSMCRADAVHGNDYVSIFPTREFGGNEAYGKYQTCKQEGKGGVYCATSWVKEIGKTVYTGEDSCNVKTEKEVEEIACQIETLKRYKTKRGTNYASDYYADEAKNKTNKYYEYLEDLTEQGIINGRSIEIETTDAEATIERYAHLDELIKRSEAVKLYSIAREDEVKWGSCLGNYFPDVTENGWYHKYVENLRTRKIVQGYKDGLFRPSRNISYAETFKVAAVSLGYIAQADAEREVELSKKYDDEGELIEQISWYEPYQTALEQRNILTKEMQTADPHAKITRGAVMSIMSRGLMEQDGIILP